MTMEIKLNFVYHRQERVEDKTALLRNSQDQDEIQEYLVS